MFKIEREKDLFFRKRVDILFDILFSRTRSGANKP